MPAISADTLTLPRLPALPEKETVWRPVAQVITAHRQLEGEGFVVRRPFPGPALAFADPFLLLDQMGAVDFGDTPRMHGRDHAAPYNSKANNTHCPDCTFSNSPSPS